MEEILDKIHNRECEKHKITDSELIKKNFKKVKDLIFDNGPDSLEDFQYLYEIFNDPIYSKHEVEKMSDSVFSSGFFEYHILDGDDEVSNFFTDILYNYISFEPGRELNYQEIQLFWYGKTLARKREEILLNINKRIKEDDMIGSAYIGNEKLNVFEVSTAFRGSENRFFNDDFFKEYKETFDELLKRRPELNEICLDEYKVELDEEILRQHWGWTEDDIPYPDYIITKEEYAEMQLLRPINEYIIDRFLNNIEVNNFGLTDVFADLPVPEPEYLHDSLPGYKKFDFWEHVAPLKHEEIKSKIMNHYKGYLFDINNHFLEEIDFIDPNIHTVYKVMEKIGIDLPTFLFDDKKEWSQWENKLIYPIKYTFTKE